jgi:translation factor GUF1, mitochondrial
MSQEGFEKLSDAMDKLTLNDASVTVRKETSAALGPGFRCGFLGMLHMDVFMQRLMDEHGSEVVPNTAAFYACFVTCFSQSKC